MAESTLKNVLSNLANLAAERGLPFLLAGGQCRCWLIRIPGGKLVPAARDVDLDQGAKAKIPDVLHLIAMKLNASRNPLRRADAADIQDVIALIKVCTLDTRSDAFQAVLDRYASAEDRAKIEAIFPDHD